MCVVRAAFLRAQAHLFALLCPAHPCGQPALLSWGRVDPRAACGTCEGLLVRVELPVGKSSVRSPL